MLRGIVVSAFLICLFPCASFAQQSGREHSIPGASLTATQKEGRRIFVQRCALCHTPPQAISKVYGPFLDKDLVEGREDDIRGTITEGRPGLMPGFQYGLAPAEIDAIVAYLETVERPARSKN
jgi:mono/diheme cytochrome c family protein